MIFARKQSLRQELKWQFIWPTQGREDEEKGKRVKEIREVIQSDASFAGDHLSQRARKSPSRCIYSAHSTFLEVDQKEIIIQSRSRERGRRGIFCKAPSLPPFPIG